MPGCETEAESVDYRPRLLGIAYRMLGSIWDAEDVVAEAMARWLRADRAQVQEPLAFLTTVVTRLALDQLRSARRAREVYTGPWLPEPVLTGPAPLGPLELVERRESLSLAILRLMEQLTPPERAVFVLREAFEVPYAEIAEILDVSVGNARQLFHRAHARIASDTPRTRPDADEHAVLLARFLDAVTHGDFDGLRDLLAADVVAYNDGGGQARAGLYPIVGMVNVTAFARSLVQHFPMHGAPRLIEVNGHGAALVTFGDQPSLVTISVKNGKIGEIFGILNSDKLAYLRRQLATQI
jgi:RNA polymerase sigma-70 factor, ECF subfamily